VRDFFAVFAAECRHDHERSAGQRLWYAGAHMTERSREVAGLREELHKLDQQIVKLIDQRARASRRLGERREGVRTLPMGERARLAELAGASEGDMPPAALRDILRAVHAACLALELPVPVAFAGAEGGAAHAAARFRFGAAAEFVRTDAASDAFEQVSRQRAEFAVVPMETRAGGSVQSTITMLAASELKLCACFEVAENLVLAGREDTALPLSDGVVYASPQDHALCERFLARELPGARVVDVRTPLVAIEHALDHKGCVLAQETFAVERGLTVLSRNVRDDGGDRVRYGVVGARPPPRSGNDRTGIAFSVADSPGALHEILARFADSGINLSKIQSQPVPGDDWKYLFYVEAEGHATDRSLVAALEEVKRVAKFIRVLGSYEQ